MNMNRQDFSLDLKLIFGLTFSGFVKFNSAEALSHYEFLQDTVDMLIYVDVCFINY